MNTQFEPRWRATVLTGGAFAALLALTACGAGTESGDTLDDAAESTATESTAASDDATDRDGPEDLIADFLDNGAEDLIVSILLDRDFNAAAEAAEPYFCAETVAEIRATGEAIEAMPEQERAEALEEFGQLESDGFAVEYEILGSTEDGDTATVEAELTSPNPRTGAIETLTNEFPMIKEDGQWQMCEPFF